MFFFVKHITKFILAINAEKIGCDEYGNTYYQHKKEVTSVGKKKRFCLYSGLPESSKVPPLWHAWLHYMSDTMPNSPVILPWYKKHLPNLTGTLLAYQYPFKSNAAKHYTAWKPGKTAKK